MTTQTRMRSRWLLPLLCALVGGAAALAPVPAQAAPRAKVLRYHKPTAGSDIDTGGAWTVVNAPLAIVRRVVQDYRRYVNVMPRLEQSRIVSRKKGETDLYIRAPILHGVVHLWAVVRFSAPKKVGRWEMIAGRYIKGNLRDYHGVWKLYPCAPDKTLLKVEMFADIKIPMPASVISPELAWVADVAVTNIRDRSECIYRSKRRGLGPAQAAPPPPPKKPPQPSPAPADKPPPPAKPPPKDPSTPAQDEPAAEPKSDAPPAAEPAAASH